MLYSFGYTAFFIDTGHIFTCYVNIIRTFENPKF